MGHIVKATMIVAKTDSTERYFEKGAILPSSVSTEERKRLVAAGVVVYVKDVKASADEDKQPPTGDEKPPVDPDSKKPDPAK